MKRPYTQRATDTLILNLEVSKLRIKVSAIINGIHLFFIVLSVIYIMLRIVIFVLVEYFDFVIYSRTLEANLWDQAWTWDIIVGFIFFLASSLYFNNRILPFLVLYKAVEETRETFSATKDMETIILFNEDDYEISDDGKIISYGKFKIPIE